MTTCPDCGSSVEPLEAFPEGRCLDCYSKLMENAPMPTAAEIVQMWGGTP